MSRRVLAAGGCPPSASAAPGDAQPPGEQGSTEMLSPLFAFKGNCSASTALFFFFPFLSPHLPWVIIFSSSTTQLAGGIGSERSRSVVDQLTAPHRVYDFIDLQQCLASMETALLAPEPCWGTSGFVLLDLREAHLYRCVFLIPKEGKGKSVVFVFGDV